MDSKLFQSIETEMPAEAIAESNAKAKRILAEIRLQEIRKKRGITQAEAARRIGVGQAYISKLESRSDVSLSKFREYVDALGGQAEIIVRFPGDDPPVYIPL